MSALDSIDADSPWLGLASFTEETRALFFGREQEVAELERRVQRKLLTVLFGKSGLGKTSILQAGLVPGLRDRGYFPVYVRIDYGHDSSEPAEQIKQAINRAAGGVGRIQDIGAAGGAERESGLKAATAGEWTQTGVTAPGESIWEFLHHRDDVLKDASGATLTPLLIFDQFEELFTLAQSDEFGRARAARFVEELADLVENRPPKALEAKLDADESLAERFDFSRSDYRVVIALREDYLAPLESLKRQMPTLSQNRLRLAPMTGSQALEAVLEPGNRLRPGKPLVSEEVAEAIVRFVAGGSELTNAEVEPSLLSLICRELNEQRIAQARNEISQDLLAGSHETILSNFYERSLADQPESVRRIIEDDLLTESGYRENLAEESLLKRFQAAGAAPDALAKLVNRRLVRIEERLDVRRVELTHDVLTGVVKASRDQRHEREAREATERMLAEQRERESAARRALRRARAVAAGCTLLAAVAIAAAIFALVSVKRARLAERVARQTRAISEQARQEAEGLLGFLTDSFVRELETFGRYQTIAELSRREIDYFQHLPEQLKDPETLRSGALALVNHAEAENYIGGQVEATKNLAEAIALLERLRRTDKSAPTTLVLGRAYTGLGEILNNQRATAKARTAYQRASELLGPLAEQADASPDARRADLDTLVHLEILDDLNGKSAQVLSVTREALRVARELGAPRSADVTVNADYAGSQSYRADALSQFNRNGEARRAADEAVAAADQILAQHPQFGRGLFAKWMAYGALRSAAANELDPSDALRSAQQGSQVALTLVNIEPGNVIYATQLGSSYGGIGDSMWDAGRLRESIPYYRKEMEVTRKSAAGTGIGVGLFIGSMRRLASNQAQLGDFAGAAATLSAASALLSPSVFSKSGSGGPSLEPFINRARAFAAATIAYERGRFAAARSILRARFGGSAAPNVDVSFLEGQIDFALGDFAAAARSERTALEAAKAVARQDVSDQRGVAQIATWLSMALAREGERSEAAQAIDPVVTMYRGLAKQNHGDRWVPLDFAEALYAQALTDDRHRAALLREASNLVDHLIPSIARLHDTREWRARIEAARRQAGRSVGVD